MALPHPPNDDPVKKLKQVQDEKDDALAEVARLQKQIEQLQKEQRQQVSCPQELISSLQVRTIQQKWFALTCSRVFL
jgi:peptidoglycan hydrolase CwlO-like protein